MIDHAKETVWALAEVPARLPSTPRWQASERGHAISLGITLGCPRSAVRDHPDRVNEALHRSRP